MTRLHWFIRFFSSLFVSGFVDSCARYGPDLTTPRNASDPKGKSQEETPSGLSAHSGYHSETGGEIHAA